MKTVVIRECDGLDIDFTFQLDLREVNPKDCCGCWSCWGKTPGKCTYRDLDEFYKRYLEADKVVILSKVKRGFVSGKMKTIFDRLIPHYLPYTEVTEIGGANHEPRYSKYPDIEFFYEGEFCTDDSRKILKEYIIRTFTQFRSKHIAFKDLKELRGYYSENNCS